MRPSKLYIKKWNEKTITSDMLIDCLYSVNKRAKTARDEERKYIDLRKRNRYFIDKYDYEGRAAEKKENYYNKKKQLLAILTPDCIHIEMQERRKRIYDYQPEYDMCKNEDIIYCNQYYDRERKRHVTFVDILIDVERYYLFYDLGKYSFHTPIANCEEYPGLERVHINKLDTHATDINDLISMQFVDKIIALIESGDYQYVA